MPAPSERPPSVDALARSLAGTGLPHPLLVDAARRAIAAGDPGAASSEAAAISRALLRPVVNATGVLLHTNLGRAPLPVDDPGRYANLELDLATGGRGSRSAHAGRLLALAAGAEAATVVNNGAAAVLLVLAALARGRGAVVSRGEEVEIGGGFRVPEVMAESGARLVEVGTTNRTRSADYQRAVDDPALDVALLLKVHRSNYRITGFTEDTTVEDLAAIGPPVVVDLGSGLLDAATPWLDGGPPVWLRDEPAARQTLAAGAALVVFSGDKLLGGPQAGVIAGRADLVAACARHPLARALRPGGLVLGALQDVALAYLRRDAGAALPFWRMATLPVSALRARAEGLGVGEVVDCASVTGGGTLPGVEIPSVGIRLPGDRTSRLRDHDPAVIARVEDGSTILDLRTVSPDEDEVVAAAARASDRVTMRVVATAGHVDHGKSTLVLALTGTDPDRLAEEKARGLTIDLGFAATTLPSGAGISFVDVPGHVRFLKNMLAGVGAVDAALFVVAATEGWKPQSEEHLRILELLGVRGAVVALTKVGGLDEDTRTLARLDVEDRIEASALAGAEVVEVDAPAGLGLDELRGALDRLVARVPAAADRGRPRLWVDRSFAAAGAGTIVTGTLAGGSLHVGDEVEILPSGQRARIRALQVHGEATPDVAPGHRLAVNLAGTDRTAVVRGHAVVRPGAWHRSDRVDASLDVLPALDHPVSRRGAYLAYLGSGEHPVQLRVLGPDRIEPGARGFVRLHLPVRLPLLPGDRYVLREAGRAETVGGGEILDVAPVLAAARARPDRSVERVVAERGWVDADELDRLTGERRAPVVGAWVVDPTVLANAEAELAARIDAAGAEGVDVATLDDRERAVLERVEGVTVTRGRARVTGVDTTDEHPFLDALRTAPFSPPAPEEAGVSRAEVHDLVRRGLVVERDGTFFAAEAIDQAARVVAALLATAPDGVTVGDVRDALGCTRKHAVPLLGALDAAGVTRRRGDRRVAGPRLPAG